jgi:acetyl esterase/lipase
MRYLFILILSIISNSVFAENSSNTFTGLKTDIPIGEVDGVTLRINLAFPESKSATPRPVMLMIHGGGLIKGDRSRFNKRISTLATQGIVGASAMYRLAPAHRFPTAIEDIKTAIRFLKANSEKFNLDPDRIIVNGVSAGAYLAVMIGVTGNANGFSHYELYPEYDSTVRAVMAQSPAIGDYTQSKYRGFPIVKRFMNLDVKDTQEALKALSPITYLDSNDPPFFLVHGSSDERVPVSMSREFVAELKALGHEYEYREIEDGKHSLNASRPKKASEVFEASMIFFNQQTR